MTANIHSSSNRAVILTDCMIRWNEATVVNDQGIVRSTTPLKKSSEFYFFEMEILSFESDVSIGLGYFDVNGNISKRSFTYSAKGVGKGMDQESVSYPSFSMGDHVTCGVSFKGLSVDPYVFFCKNGSLVEPALHWKGISDNSFEVFPFVSCAHGSNMVKLRFGKDVIYDVELLVQEMELERSEQRKKQVHFEDGSGDSICKSVIKDFLLHHGYIESLKQMEEEDNDRFNRKFTTNNNGHTTKNHHRLLDQQDIQLAKERKVIRSLILQGKLTEATGIIKERWALLMNTPVGLELRVQCLVELILSSSEEAVKHARTELWPYLSSEATQQQAQIAKQALGLFAHMDPKSAPTKIPLFAPSRRRSLADSVSRAMVFYPNPARSPALERIIQRISDGAQDLKKKAGGYGPDFDVEQMNKMRKRFLSSFLLDLSTEYITSSCRNQHDLAKALSIQLTHPEAFKSFASIDRALFLKSAEFCEPYINRPQKIYQNENMSTPYHHATILNRLAPFLKSAQSVLDVGCGTGYLTAAFFALANENGAANKTTVIGVERVPHLCQEARSCLENCPITAGQQARGKIKIVQDGRWENLSQHGPYDVIHLGFSLNPDVVADDNQRLNKLIATLRRGSQSVLLTGIRNELCLFDSQGRKRVVGENFIGLAEVRREAFLEPERRSERKAKLKEQLEVWKQQFEAENAGRKPTREDMFASATASKLFQDFTRL